MDVAVSSSIPESIYCPLITSNPWEQPCLLWLANMSSFLQSALLLFKQAQRWQNAITYIRLCTVLQSNEYQSERVVSKLHDWEVWCALNAAAPGLQSVTQHSNDELAIHCNASCDVTPHGITKVEKPLSYCTVVIIACKLLCKSNLIILLTLHSTYSDFKGLHLVLCCMPWEAGGYCPVGIGSYEVESIVADGLSLKGLEQVLGCMTAAAPAQRG